MGYFNWGLTERQSKTVKSIVVWFWAIITWAILISLIYFVATLVILPALDIY